MLQPAYFARNVSENAFSSLDQEFTQYQNDHPWSTSYILELHADISSEEMEKIALHFSDAGYDIFSSSSDRLMINWASAEADRTGVINIRTDLFACIRNAKKKNEE